MSPKYRIGVDVGGTNTDGVVINVMKSGDLSTRGIIASCKQSTTSDVTIGIEAVVQKVIHDAGLDPKSDDILSLTVGTTHFVNAVVQKDTTRLSKVAVIRLAAPYATECPSFIDFPERLKSIMKGHTATIKGGLQIDGRKINELDVNEIKTQATIIREKGLKSVVIIGIFSPLDVNGHDEYKARNIFQQELGPDVNIVCSRDVGQVGFIERENASILNASIMSFAHHTISGFQRAMKRLGLACPLYLTQNDGTLTTASEAARLPIRTFSSGPTNSMRGASYLAGLDLKSKEGLGKSMIVVDIGGTTTDIGMLLPSGFPRQAAAFIEVAGVRTNFSMPDVHSIGLGGGSRVRIIENGSVWVGPDSVGHDLPRDARVFGGDVLTASDIVVRSGHQLMGNPDLVSSVPDDIVGKAQYKIQTLLERAIDRMKTSPDDCDLLLVGGGSIISPPTLKGVSNIIKPPFYEVANAVGAAIANVSAIIDTIEILEGKSLEKTLDSIKKNVLQKLNDNGADPSTARIAEIHVLPVQYVTNQATRLIVRAVGELDLNQSKNVLVQDLDIEDEPESLVIYTSATSHPKNESTIDIEDVKIDYRTYRPRILDKEWIVSETDLFFIMEGCGILGTGGGGSPYSAYLRCRQIIRDGGTIRIVDHSSLQDNAFVVRGGFMGSPSVASERIKGEAALYLAGTELSKYCGITACVATLCDEIGGGNGMESLAMSKYYGVPAFDGDLMGRAYPKLNQVLPAVYERPNALVPCALSDGDGNVVLLTKVKNEHFVESIMRTVTTEMGSSAALCPPPMCVRDVRDYGVPNTLSQAWRMGRAVAICRQMNNLKAVSDAILRLQNGKQIFIGKIINVSREVRSGFTWGEIKIAPLHDDELEDLVPGTEYSNILVIPFQNENLCAYMEDHLGSRTIVASVPDLIVVLDSQSGSHLGTPEYMYGLRVTVLALAGHPLWNTSVGLASGGPAAFGLEHECVPVGQYLPPKSVIAEFGVE